MERLIFYFYLFIGWGKKQLRFIQYTSPSSDNKSETWFIIKLSVMRTSNRSIRDILTKRQKKSIQSLDPTDSIQVINPFATGKEIQIQAVIEKLERLKANRPTKCELNNEEKYSIVEVISQKYKASFNKNTLVALMTVWKIPGSHQLQLTDDCLKRSSTKDLESQTLFKNYFVLCGRLNIFDRQKVVIKRQAQKGKIFNLVSDEDDGVFGTEAKWDINRQVEAKGSPISVIEQFNGWGPLFRNKEQKKNICVTAVDAIVVQIKNPQFESMLINLGGMDQDKKAKIIECFPIFSSIGKRIQSILPYIELKHYTRNQHIYNANQTPQAVYLIIKGQVIFQMKVYTQESSSRNTHTHSLNVNQLYKNNSAAIFQTETLGINNFFGEEQIINKCERKLTSICHSAQCQLLQIPIQKFQKLLTNSDFMEVVKMNTVVKIQKRSEKIDKAMEVYVKMMRNPEANKERSVTNTQRINTADSLARRKKASQPPKLMHGNVIKRVRANNMAGEVNFSMLKANPDMYEATMKKFRKFTMKPVQKYKPKLHRTEERVWKVLNLENILREDTQLSSPEGRRFYESHRRFQNHVNEVKSLRPKTSSSTYRTKLQYISYLQQFNN